VSPRRLADAPAPLLVVGAAFSVQGGAALATTAFDEAGPLGFVWLRVAFASLILAALSARSLPRLRSLPLGLVLATGGSVALMNACFYQAIDRIPLGSAVTIEFLGPLAVAVAGSRRPLDFLWIALAGCGVALLGSPSVDLDPAGIGFALAAAAGWAAYIVLAKRLLSRAPLVAGLTATLLVAAVLLAPLGLAAGGSGLVGGGVLATGVAVAVLGSVLPFALGLLALRRVPTSTFGILQSLEPAVAALVGAVALAQVPGVLEALAIVFVSVASAGASARAPRPPPREG
jgi:inner membrane transporter RhtA